MHCFSQNLVDAITGVLPGNLLVQQGVAFKLHLIGYSEAKKKGQKVTLSHYEAFIPYVPANSCLFTEQHYHSFGLV